LSRSSPGSLASLAPRAAPLSNGGYIAWGTWYTTAPNIVDPHALLVVPSKCSVVACLLPIDVYADINVVGFDPSYRLLMCTLHMLA
jgi:hypothetical protein